MDGVKQYGFWHNKEWEGQPGEFEEMPEGPYVKHTDYAALETQLAEANATIARLSAPVSDEEIKNHTHHDDWGVTCWYADEVTDLIAARKEESNGK